jgi:hypothetical protein
MAFFATGKDFLGGKTLSPCGDSNLNECGIFSLDENRMFYFCEGNTVFFRPLGNPVLGSPRITSVVEKQMEDSVCYYLFFEAESIHGSRLSFALAVDEETANLWKVKLESNEAS